MNLAGRNHQIGGRRNTTVSDITTRVVDAVGEAAGSDGWCSREQVVALMTQRGVDRMEIQRALGRATDEGRLAQDGDRYRRV